MSRVHSQSELTDADGAGWLAVLWRLYSKFSDDRILLIAAGITFYALLALFPAITALISIAGVAIDPARITDQLRAFAGVVPEAALNIISDQMQRIANQPSDYLSIAFVTGLAIALWSANNDIKALFQGLNVVHAEADQRSFLRLNAISLAFTMGAIIIVILALLAIVVVPVLVFVFGS